MEKYGFTDKTQGLSIVDEKQSPGFWNSVGSALRTAFGGEPTIEEATRVSGSSAIGQGLNEHYSKVESPAGYYLSSIKTSGSLKKSPDSVSNAANEVMHKQYS